MIGHARMERLASANALLRVIADNGRHFFTHEGRFAEFVIRDGRLYFVDSWSCKKVYMHREAPSRGFTGGGTLWSLCKELKAFIWDGTKVRAGTFGPWPDWYCAGDLWGYGDAMQIVRREAQALGVVELDPIPPVSEVSR